MRSQLLPLLLLAASATAAAQTEPQPVSAPEPQPAHAQGTKPKAVPVAPDPDQDPARHHLESHVFQHLAQDQYAIWTSPARVRATDFRWIIPVAGLSAITLPNDEEAVRRLSGTHKSRIDLSSSLSNAGLFAIAGLGGGMYFYGVGAHAPHARETGVLSAEAGVNALIVDEALKNVFRRQRPFTGPHESDFFAAPFKVPSDASFPSGHAIISFAVASVIAHEYPGWLTKTAVYGAASVVSVARVTAQKHFPTDVLIGGVSGYLIGRTVYNRHHDLDEPGADIGTFSHDDTEDTVHRSVASPYLPLDHWAYRIFDRLSAMGYIRSDLFNVRPWTRLECARLLLEADETERLHDYPDPAVVAELRDLHTEFDPDIAIFDGGPNRSASIQKVYTRVTGIAGPPVTDGYHFGSSIVNDFGRPYQQGFNDVTGVIANVDYKGWNIYFNPEYQHAPSGPPIPVAAQLGIQFVDRNSPPQGDGSTPVINRVRLQDSYISRTFRNVQVSFGQQSLWWGPATSGGMIFSNNAPPITMLRFTTVRPFELPWLFRILGETRLEFLMGHLDGHHFVRTFQATYGPHLSHQPLIHAEKVEFKPTQNLEFGVSLSAVFAGTGVPYTPHTFIHAFSSGNTFPGAKGDPGDRRTSFDFSYRLPFFRNWLTLYSDSFSEDEYNPIAYERRSAFVPGLYLSHFPFYSRADFRAEGFYTDLPNLRDLGFFYSNSHYLNGYTNDGSIIGHWIGRMGRGWAGYSNIYLSGENTIRLSYRHSLLNPAFLRGGRQDAGSIEADWRLTPRWAFSAGTQIERYEFPILYKDAKTDVATYFTISLDPKWRKAF